MNKKVIKTFEDLTLEEQRLTAHLANLKVTIKDDIGGVKQGVKDKLNPVKKVKETVSNLFTRGDKNGPALNFTLNFVLDYILRLFIPNKTSVWTKTIIPFITKNYVSHLVTDEHRKSIQKFVDNVIGKVDRKMRKSSIKKVEEQYKTPEAEAALKNPEPVIMPAPTGVDTNPMNL
jgi:hypothetical protein